LSGKSSRGGGRWEKLKNIGKREDTETEEETCVDW